MNDLSVMLLIVLSILIAIAAVLRKLGKLHQQELEEKRKEQQP
ncbi:hypothetical protein ACFPVS_02665 [Neisseria weixii]|nr:hypothetical protein [Neisseria weixii]